MQAGLAIASSCRLGNSDWQANAGHGLDLVAPQVAAGTVLDFNNVVIRSRGRHMAAQVLAEALESPLLTGDVTLAQLIASLRDQPIYHAGDSDIRLPLVINVYSGPASMSLDVMRGINVEKLGRDSAGQVPIQELQDVFANYPSFRSIPLWQSATVEQGWVFDCPDFVRLEYPLNQWFPWSQLDPYFDEWASDAHGGRGDPVSCVYPALGANTVAQHPLLTWYLCMYAFSILARYHPASWRALLNKEETIVAGLLENLVQERSEDAFDLVGGVLQQIVS